MPPAHGASPSVRQRHLVRGSGGASFHDPSCRPRPVLAFVPWTASCALRLLNGLLSRLFLWLSPCFWGHIHDGIALTGPASPVSLGCGLDAVSASCGR